MSPADSAQRLVENFWLARSLAVAAETFASGDCGLSNAEAARDALHGIVTAIGRIAEEGQTEADQLWATMRR